MFECTLDDGTLFRKIISALSGVVEQGNFHIDDDVGLTFQSMDSSHVSLVAVRLQKDAFSHWRCDSDGETIGIQFASLSKILKCMGQKDKLSISHTPDIDEVNFIFADDEKGQSCDFSLKLMDIEMDQMGIPDNAYDAVVTMPSTEFQRICRDLSAIGDAVTISLTNDGVKFSVVGDIGNGSINIKASNEADIDNNDDEESKEKKEKSMKITVDIAEVVEQDFSIKFLNNFAKATALSPTVRISMGRGSPLQLSYDIDGVGYIRYYLAPKIEDDNEMY